MWSECGSDGEKLATRVAKSNTSNLIIDFLDIRMTMLRRFPKRMWTQRPNSRSMLMKINTEIGSAARRTSGGQFFSVSFSIALQSFWYWHRRCRAFSSQKCQKRSSSDFPGWSNSIKKSNSLQLKKCRKRLTKSSEISSQCLLFCFCSCVLFYFM